MKRFFHPVLRSETLTTSLGKITLDKNGSAEVEDEVFDHLMKNPVNAAYPENRKQMKSIVPTLEEYVKAGYPAETYEERFRGFKAGDVLDDEAIRKNQEEFARKQSEKDELKDELKEEDLKLLELPDLKVIAKQHKVKFSKDVTKDDLIVSIMDEIKKPPPLPPPTKPEKEEPQSGTEG